MTSVNWAWPVGAGAHDVSRGSQRAGLQGWHPGKMGPDAISSPSPEADGRNRNQAGAMGSQLRTTQAVVLSLSLGLVYYTAKVSQGSSLPPMRLQICAPRWLPSL